jgi:hypothetical protein
LEKVWRKKNRFENRRRWRKIENFEMLENAGERESKYFRQRGGPPEIE